MGRMREDLLTALVETSISLNGVLIPAGTIPSSLAKFVAQLTAFNDDPVWRISLLGSSTLVSYRGRHFALCCLHQLRGWDLQRISLLTQGGKFAVSSGGVRHFTKRV